MKQKKKKKKKTTKTTTKTKALWAFPNSGTDTN